MIVGTIPLGRRPFLQSLHQLSSTGNGAGTAIAASAAPPQPRLASVDRTVIFHLALVRNYATDIEVTRCCIFTQSGHRSHTAYDGI